MPHKQEAVQGATPATLSAWPAEAAAGRLVMALVGQTATQYIHAIWQGVSTAMVSKGEWKGSRCGQTATQAPHWMQAGQLTSNMTG